MAVRVGFLGTGGMAAAHMKNLSQLGAELVAMCDVDPERARAAADRYGAVAYTDHAAMFDRERLDVLYVCVPPFAHQGQEVLAARRGIHLFVEKPVALSLAQARQVEQAVRAAGVINAVGYHWRYEEATEFARRYLDGRPVGLVMGYWVGGLPGVAWWRRREGSGGQVVEQATHIVDLARYLVGEVKAVCAAEGRRMLTAVPDMDVADATAVMLEFAGGAVGTLTTSCAAPGYRVGLHLAVQGAVVEVQGRQAVVVEEGRTETRRFQRDPYLREDEAFLAAVTGAAGQDVRSTYADALLTLQVTLAINLSAATGRRVAVESL